MKAETTRRPLLPAWASALRMKWTRQRCQVAAEHAGPSAALMPFVRVGDDQLHAAQAAAGELAQELGPERLGFGGPIVHAEHLAPAVAC